MTKILSQSFVLCMAVAIVSISFLGLEAKAQESVSTNSFFLKRVIAGCLRADQNDFACCTVSF